MKESEAHLEIKSENYYSGRYLVYSDRVEILDFNTDLIVISEKDLDDINHANERLQYKPLKESEKENVRKEIFNKYKTIDIAFSSDVFGKKIVVDILSWTVKFEK